VIEEAQRRGLVPVWSTGEDDHASKRVAEKLGFMIAWPPDLRDPTED